MLFLMLLIQVATGLVLAGTDLFWPPFGRLFAAWVAAPGIDPAMIHPNASDLIDKPTYQSMRAFRGPFVLIHEITFYALAATIVLHLIAVVVTEIHEGGGILSAMITGRKILTKKPPDAPITNSNVASDWSESCRHPEIEFEQLNAPIQSQHSS